MDAFQIPNEQPLENNHPRQYTKPSNYPSQFVTPNQPSPYLMQKRVFVSPPPNLRSMSGNEFSIYDYYCAKEGVLSPLPTYLTTIQNSLTSRERMSAIEMMFWLHKRMGHEFEKTFVLGMRMFDRFCSKRKIPHVRDLYKLIVTCIFVAGKYQECYLHLGINDIVDCLNTSAGMLIFGFKEEDFFEAEKRILKDLDYRLTLPILDDFVSLMTENERDSEKRKIHTFLTLFACTEYCLLRFDLSVISCAIVSLAEMIWNDWTWEEFDKNKTNVIPWKKDLGQVYKCARILWSLIQKKRFDILKKVFADSKHTIIKDSKVMTIFGVVEIWGQKIKFLEAQKNKNKNKQNQGFTNPNFNGLMNQQQQQQQLQQQQLHKQIQNHHQKMRIHQIQIQQNKQRRKK